MPIQPPPALAGQAGPGASVTSEVPPGRADEESTAGKAGHLQAMVREEQEAWEATVFRVRTAPPARTEETAEQEEQEA